MTTLGGGGGTNAFCLPHAESASNARLAERNFGTRAQRRSPGAARKSQCSANNTTPTIRTAFLADIAFMVIPFVKSERNNFVADGPLATKFKSETTLKS